MSGLEIRGVEYDENGDAWRLLIGQLFDEDPYGLQNAVMFMCSTRGMTPPRPLDTIIRMTHGAFQSLNRNMNIMDQLSPDVRKKRRELLQKQLL